jgi:hypothetical protein
MFRALSVLNGGTPYLQREGFVNPKARSAEGFNNPKARSAEGFVNPTDHPEFAVAQTTRFTKQLPNSYLTTQTDPALIGNSMLGLATWDPNTRQPTQRDLNLQKFGLTTEISPELVAKHNQCKVASIDTLLGSENPNAKFRCGWIYTKGTPGNAPRVSQGAVGSRSGPMPTFENPVGTWFWDLEEAKKQILKDRCGALTDCKSAGSDSYKQCAFSTKRGIGVPVDSRGQLLYPRDPTLSAPPDSLITNAGGCPKPPPPGSPQYELARSRDVCMPLPDGRLPRDCLLQQITAAGCTNDGSLYNSLLNDSLPSNYAAGLKDLESFKKYQQLSGTPLLDNVVREGRSSTAIALDNFSALSKTAAVVNDSALSYAARDLCFQRGTMDNYDFCLDIADTTGGPYNLTCLQSAFRKAGGQPAGSDYPTSTNKSKWDQMPTWGAVKEAMAALGAKTKSSDEPTQRDALKRFLGIVRPSRLTKQIPIIPGIEVLWFDRGQNTFLGRRGQRSGAFPDFSGGELGGTKRAVNVEYVAFTNLRPPTDTQVRFRLTNDDGSVVVLNEVGNPEAASGTVIETKSMFGTWWNQPPTQYAQQKCWKLAGKGPNYIVSYFFQGGGGAFSKTEYQPCAGGQFTAIPSNWFTLTQEPDAPMLSWQIIAGNDISTSQFTEYRMPQKLGLSQTPQTSLVETGVPALPMGLKLRTGSSSGKANTSANLAMNSWRTLTVAFIAGDGNSYADFGECGTLGFPSPDNALRLYKKEECDTLGGNFSANGECIKPGIISYSGTCRTLNTAKGSILLNLGPLTISLAGSDLIFNWESATLSTSHTFRKVITPNGKTPYLVSVNMRSQYNNMYPNTLTFAQGSFDDWKSGRVTLEATPNNSMTFQTKNNAPLYNESDAAVLTIGDPALQNSANATVGYVHAFDYELDNNDIIKDVKNEFLREFVR